MLKKLMLMSIYKQKSHADKDKLVNYNALQKMRNALLK